MLSKAFIKYIQTLHHKKFRDDANVFIAEGSKTVMELLMSEKISCREIIGLEDWLHDNEASIRKKYKGALHIAEQFELEKISSLSTPNHVLGVFEKPVSVEFSTKENISILLDDIQDPGNFGTIIRIADWFGIVNIVCSPHCVDLYNSKVVQSTMGSIARVNVVYSNLADWIRLQHPVKIFATTLNGKNVTTIKGLKEGILIIGNESKGISEELLQLADEKISIPKYGAAESLNAAVATGIILSHLN